MVGTRFWIKPVTRRALISMLLLILGLSTVHADEYQDRRLRMGARLFRSLLAADLDIEQKAGADGRLLILFYVDGDQQEAAGLAEDAFKGLDAEHPATVRGMTVRVELVNDATFDAYSDVPVAGIFLVHHPDDDGLQTIIQFGIDHHVVVFSPHEGDVEKGVLGGLIIEAQVLPYVNLSTARKSGIPIKQFFLEVAKVAE